MFYIRLICEPVFFHYSQEAVKEAQKALNEQKEILKACNKDIEQRRAEQNSLSREGNAADLQLQELDHKITKSHKDSKEAAKLVRLRL